MCLVNQKELLQLIVKFGMLNSYPHFVKHFKGMESPEDLIQQAIDDEDWDALKMARIQKAIEESAQERVSKARELISKYHSDSEKRNMGTNKYEVVQNRDGLYKIEEETFDQGVVRKNSI